MSEPVWIEKDLGAVDSYAEAVEAGFTGTHEDFAQLLANVDNYSAAAVSAATAAEASATYAEDAAEDAEAYAIGRRNGEEVDEEDPAYHNNAEYYAEQAAESATEAGAAQTAAEAAQAAAEAAAAQEVGAWLAEHVDPDTGYVIDDTLTIEDAAADAKKTGEKIAEAKSIAQNALTLLYSNATTVSPSQENPVDLNNYTSPGNFRFNSLNVMDYVAHKPRRASGRLFVYTTNGATYICQMYIANVTAGFQYYIRSKNGNSNSWTDWYYLNNPEIYDALADEGDPW